MRKITRREFLRHAAGTAVGYELGHRLTWAGQAAPAIHAESLPAVVVAKGTNADSAAKILQTALDGLGGIGRFVKPGQTVAIKPNATWDYPPGTASSTDPDLLRALIQMVRDAGAKRIIVCDHVSIDPGTAEALRVSGIGAVVDEMGVEKVFPDRYLFPEEIFAPIDLPQAKTPDFRKLGMIKAAVEADVRINMAIAKSHLVTKYTLCLKHMMGFLKYPTSLHVQLEQGIADINTPSAVQCQLHILEAIRVRLPVGNRRQAGGDETELTDPKRVKRLNQIAAGTDPVLMDAYGLVNYFSVKPQELAHVKIAAEMGLGEINVEKASADGRLVVHLVGQPTPTPTASPTQTQTAMPALAATAPPLPTPTGPTPTHTPPPTNTPLPTATPEPVLAVPVAAAARGACERAGTGGVNPNPFLNGALIPAAAVVAGVGMVVRRRLGQAEKDREDGSASQ